WAYCLGRSRTRRSWRACGWCRKNSSTPASPSTRVNCPPPSGSCSGGDVYAERIFCCRARAARASPSEILAARADASLTERRRVPRFAPLFLVALACAPAYAQTKPDAPNLAALGRRYGLEVVTEAPK